MISLDIAVHKRDYDEEIGFDNFICIEMKKDNDSRGTEGVKADEDRLEKLTNLGLKEKYNYKAGYMLLAKVTGTKEEMELTVANSFYLHSEI